MMMQANLSAGGAKATGFSAYDLSRKMKTDKNYE